MMKQVTAFLAISSCMLLASIDVVLAAQPTAPNPNRPSATCGTAGAPNFPGNAALSPGSPFNEPGSMGPTSPGGKAGSVYAGATTSPSQATTQNVNAFSGYDVACSQVP
jgi:hypothetical protein